MTVLVKLEAAMLPVGVVRVGDMIHLDYDGETWVLPVELVRRLASDRKLIDDVRRETLPSITRRTKREDN